MVISGVREVATMTIALAPSRPSLHVGEGKAVDGARGGWRERGGEHTGAIAYCEFQRQSIWRTRIGARPEHTPKMLSGSALFVYSVSEVENRGRCFASLQETGQMSKLRNAILIGYMPVKKARNAPLWNI